MNSTPKPGERRILQALALGDKRFKELLEGCVKNPTILSFYLKNFQKQGLIIKDLDTRRFKLKDRAWETLYLADIRDLIEEYGLGKMNVKLWGLDVIVSENPAMFQYIEGTLKHGSPSTYATCRSFSRITQLMFLSWKRQVLSSFKERERKAVKRYEHDFKEAMWFLIPPKERPTREEARSRAEEMLRRRYPGMDIPEKSIQMETSKVAEELEEVEKRIKSLEIGNVKKLKEQLSGISHFTKQDQTKVNTLMAFLEDHENANLFERYLKRLRKCPKTLVIFSSLAFTGYLEKYWKFFPAEEKALRKNNPWLYTRIKENFM